LGIDPGPAAWLGLFVVLGVLGVLVGWFAASIDL
jgi:hypothetical protein